jgi:hypothetical protein
MLAEGWVVLSCRRSAGWGAIIGTGHARWIRQRNKRRGVKISVYFSRVRLERRIKHDCKVVAQRQKYAGDGGNSRGDGSSWS